MQTILLVRFILSEDPIMQYFLTRALELLGSLAAVLALSESYCGVLRFLGAF